jgi:hypothetical protein
MISMLHAIGKKVGAEINDDPHFQALSEDTKPERLARQIKAREGP